MKFSNLQLILFGVAIYAVYKLHQSGSLKLPGQQYYVDDLSGAL